MGNLVSLGMISPYTGVPIRRLVQDDGPLFSNIMALCTDARHAVGPDALKDALAAKLAVKHVIEYIHMLKDHDYAFPKSRAKKVTKVEYDSLLLHTPWEEVSQLCIDLYEAISDEVVEKRCIGMVNKMDQSLKIALEDMTAAAAADASAAASASASASVSASASAFAASALASASASASAFAADAAAFAEKAGSGRYSLAVAPVVCAAKLAAAFVPKVVANYDLPSIMCGLAGIDNWPIAGMTPLDPVVTALTSFSGLPPDQQIEAIPEILRQFDVAAKTILGRCVTEDKRYVYRYTYCDPREGSLGYETGHEGWLEELGHYFAFLREGLAISLPYMHAVPAASDDRLVIVWHDGELINWPDKKDARSPLALIMEARAAIAAGKSVAEVKEKFVSDFDDGILSPIHANSHEAAMFPTRLRYGDYPYATAVLERGRLRFIWGEAHRLLSEAKEAFLASLESETP